MSLETWGLFIIPSSVTTLRLSHGKRLSAGNILTPGTFPKVGLSPDPAYFAWARFDNKESTTIIEILSISLAHSEGFLV